MTPADLRAEIECPDCQPGDPTAEEYRSRDCAACPLGPDDAPWDELRELGDAFVTELCKETR
ncbi:MAG TPA: hypothetical protein VFV33_21825 [Gemmatimonadaceae bacterium]|nr:hypothetical protein [Gemmatimonadaceae bacterium]